MSKILLDKVFKYQIFSLQKIVAYNDTKQLSRQITAVLKQ